MFNCNANVRAGVLCSRERPFLRGNIKQVPKSHSWHSRAFALHNTAVIVTPLDVKWIDAMLARKEPDNRLHRWLAGMENANRSICAPKSCGRSAFRPASVIDVYYSPEAPADTVLRTSWPADWLAGYLRYFVYSRRSCVFSLVFLSRSFTKLITRLSITNTIATHRSISAWHFGYAPCSFSGWNW